MQNCFLMPSRLKSHIILVLDRLQCVARVNCLVDDNGRRNVVHIIQNVNIKREVTEVKRISNCMRFALKCRK